MTGKEPDPATLARREREASRRSRGGGGDDDGDEEEEELRYVEASGIPETVRGWVTVCVHLCMLVGWVERVSHTNKGRHLLSPTNTSTQTQLNIHINIQATPANTSRLRWVLPLRVIPPLDSDPTDLLLDHNLRRCATELVV